VDGAICLGRVGSSRTTLLRDDEDTSKPSESERFGGGTFVHSCTSVTRSSEVTRR
jgi:hypothetical protein